MIKSINDIKKIIVDIREGVGDKHELYEDLSWFCDVNYTTTSEYFGELRQFLQKCLARKDLTQYNESMRSIINAINTIM